MQKTGAAFGSAGSRGKSCGSRGPICKGSYLGKIVVESDS